MWHRFHRSSHRSQTLPGESSVFGDGRGDSVNFVPFRKPLFPVCNILKTRHRVAILKPSQAPLQILSSNASPRYDGQNRWHQNDTLLPSLFLFCSFMLHGRKIRKVREKWKNWDLVQFSSSFLAIRSINMMDTIQDYAKFTMFTWLRRGPKMETSFIWELYLLFQPPKVCNHSTYSRVLGIKHLFCPQPWKCGWLFLEAK